MKHSEQNQDLLALHISGNEQQEIIRPGVKL